MSQIKEFKFSKTLAKAISPEAAVVLQFLAFQTELHRVNIDGKRWFYHSLDQLAKRYEGFISRSAIHRHLTKAVKLGFLEMRSKVVQRTRVSSYAFTSPSVTKIAMANGDEALWFDPEIAKERNSIIQAVIIHNLAYRILKTRERTPDYTWQEMSAYNVANHTGLKRATVTYAFHKLVEDKVIDVKPVKNGYRNCYTFVDKVRYLNECAANYVNHQKRGQENLAFIGFLTEQNDQLKMGQDQLTMGCSIKRKIIRDNNKRLPVAELPAPEISEDIAKGLRIFDDYLTNNKIELPCEYEEA